MNEEQVTLGRRVNRRYSADDRERLIREHAASGLTKKAFCEQQGIKVGTFMGWCNSYVATQDASPFAQVELAADTSVAVAIVFRNGARVGIRYQGRRGELVALVRGVAGAE